MTHLTKSLIYGVVTENLPNASFRVKVDNSDNVMLCQLAGKMRVNWVRILPGDRVTVEVDQYDVNRGRIVAKAR